MITWPVTCPAATGEATQTIADATSSSRATFRKDIVAVARVNASSSSARPDIGSVVQPGATTLTRPFGASLAISFLSVAAKPYAIAAFAAA